MESLVCVPRLKHMVYAVGKSCVTWKKSLPHFGLRFLNVKWSSWFPWFLMSFPSNHRMIGWKESILASSLGFVSKKCMYCSQKLFPSMQVARKPYLHQVSQKTTKVHISENEVIHISHLWTYMPMFISLHSFFIYSLQWGKGRGRVYL